MKRPQSQRELMTFLGFIQYLKKFMPNMADISAPLRKLTEKDVEWKWTETEENSFNKLKKLATEAPVLRFYDPTLPLTLSVDLSSTGLGCIIMQEGQPAAYASHALTKMQQNYAQIEKETLAVVFRCEKFHQFVYGQTVEVETDHRPLQSIFNKPLHQAPVRLQCFLLQLQKYDLQVTCTPGKYLYVADTLSQSYLQETKEQLVSEMEINDGDKCNQPQVVFTHLTRKVHTVPARNCKRLGTESPEQCDSQRMARQQRTCISSCQTVLVLQR